MRAANYFGRLGSIVVAVGVGSAVAAGVAGADTDSEFAG